jgi:hypothetical protein
MGEINKGVANTLKPGKKYTKKTFGRVVGFAWF